MTRRAKYEILFEKNRIERVVGRIMARGRLNWENRRFSYCGLSRTWAKMRAIGRGRGWRAPGC